MRISAAVAAIAASAAFVSASPLRVIVLSNAVQNAEPAPFINMRLGHAASPINNPNLAIMTPGQGAPAAPMHRRPCGGARFRQKAVEIANSFRKAFGLPLIQPDHHQGPTGHGAMTMEVISPDGKTTFVKLGKHNPGEPWTGFTKGGDRVQMNAPLPPPPGYPPHPRPHHHHGPAHHSKGAEVPFSTRLEGAIMSLGPWEGRAVAFVIGAGIGVLIRMLYVLAVVVFRNFSGEKEYSSVADHDEDEEDDEPARRGTPLSAPPGYVYPVDEKVEYAEEAPKAQATN
ncbi:hypothetical protein DFP72DRAFT_974604 [Ephemerocybe angulata]|uniref:Uncharacterized protein n=1 Tax=Ephemerocybe angulata TaxID=980116 RepID=A0A8H6HDF8_9AGAR|nr:hypothetical protein DFP72DRAFT_974604 [Tulosesus angulatus]